MQVFEILHFVKFLMIYEIGVSKNSECHFEVLRVSSYVEYVP